MDLIIKECDSYFISLVEKIYDCNFRNFLLIGLNSNFINDIYILEKFHKIYLKLGDKLDSDLSSRLKEISDKYLFLICKHAEYINGLNINENNIIINHSLYNVSQEDLDLISELSSDFSLDELISYETVCKYDDKRIAGVYLITPIQTVCMYNDFENGHIGSGYHNDSFIRIIRAIYGEKFIYDDIDYVDSWQDIMVSISNSIVSTMEGDIQIVNMIVEVPVPISVSQKKALEQLNEKVRNSNIAISASLVNHFNDEFFIEFEGRNNLDDLLDWLVVLDDYDFEYKDKNIIGFLNDNNIKIKQ